jgi:hypothetical protein
MCADWAGCSGDLPPPLPPAEQATACEEQAGRFGTHDGTRDRGNGYAAISMTAGTDDRQHAERVTVELGEFAEALIKQPVIVADQPFPRQYSQGVIFWTNRCSRLRRKRLDSMIGSGDPIFAKLDVEGYEEEVCSAVRLFLRIRSKYLRSRQRYF